MRNEDVRAQFAQLRVAPADQGLGGHHAAVVQADLRLVDQVELIVVQRAMQAAFDLQAVVLALRQLR